MRSLWVLLVTVVLVVGFDIWGRYELKRMGEEGAALAANLALEQSVQALDAAESHYAARKKLLSVLADRSHGETIQELLAEAHWALDYGKADEMDRVARLLALAWRDAGERADLALGNII